MPNRLAITIVALSALVITGLYPAPPPVTQAAANDWLLTWSSDSYRPLDYEGRALPSRGSRVKVLLLPTKKTAQNPEVLYYRWLLDGQVVSSAQGRGKSVFEFNVTQWGGRRHEIACQILDDNDNVLWRGSETIPIAAPEILLKSTDSAYALSDSLTTATGKSLQLTAQPLFFHAPEISDLIFNWTIDGQALTAVDGKNQNTLIIKIPDGELADPVFKNLSVLIKSRNDELQQLTAKLLLEIK